MSSSSYEEGRNMSVDRFVDSTMNGRRESPGPAAKGESTLRTLMTLPSIQDKDVLNGMIVKILNVLSVLGYPEKFRPSHFRVLPRFELRNMFSFLVHIMVGPKNGKDEVAYLSESLDFLGCPVTFKTYQLMTLTTSSTLPQTITALCWLACYVEDFMGLRTKTTGFRQPDLRDDDEAVMHETWNTYMRLFYAEISGTEVNLKEELDDYKSQIADILDPSPATSLADMKRELEEKMDRKEKLFAKIDPRTHVINVIAGQNETLEKEGQRLAELQMKLDEFTNLITALECAQEYLEKTLARKQDLEKAIQVVGQIEVGEKELAELKQDNEEDAKLIEILTAKATEIDGRVERLRHNKLTEVEAEEYLEAIIIEARSKGNANLAKLNDPEFRRKVLAKRSGSKTVVGGCGTNANGGSDKDSLVKLLYN